jgi:hypothetical protein
LFEENPDDLVFLSKKTRNKTKTIEKNKEIPRIPLDYPMIL